MSLHSEPTSPTTPLNPTTPKLIPAECVQVQTTLGGTHDVPIRFDDTVASLKARVAAAVYGDEALTSNFYLIGPQGPLDDALDAHAQDRVIDHGVQAGCRLTLSPRLQSGLQANFRNKQTIGMSELNALFGSSLNDLILAAAQGRPATVNVNIDGQTLQLNIQPQFDHGSNEVSITVSMDEAAAAGVPPHSSTATSMPSSSPSASSSPSFPLLNARRQHPSSPATKRDSNGEPSSPRNQQQPTNFFIPLPGMMPIPVPTSPEEEEHVRRLIQLQHDKLRHMASEQKKKDQEHDKLKNKLDSVKARMAAKKLKAKQSKDAKQQQQQKVSSPAAAAAPLLHTPKATTSTPAAPTSVQQQKKQTAPKGFMGLKRGFLL